MRTPQHSIRIMKAVDFVRKQRSGGSKPLLLRLEDGRIAHVKFQRNPQTTRSLVNDLIGTLLGHSLKAPVAEAVLVDVPSTLRAQIPYLTKYRWLPGLQFGTIYIEDAIPIKQSKRHQDISNWSELPLCALLETWLFNQDVKLSHVLCVPENGMSRFMIVDHGFIFPSGPLWSIHDLKRRKGEFPSPDALTWLALRSPHRFNFEDALNRISALSSDNITSVISLVPAEWGLSSQRMRAIADFLAYRQKKLGNVATKFQTLWNRNKEEVDDDVKTPDSPSSSLNPPLVAEPVTFHEVPHIPDVPFKEDMSQSSEKESKKSDPR